DPRRGDAERLAPRLEGGRAPAARAPEADPQPAVARAREGDPRRAPPPEPEAATPPLPERPSPEQVNEQGAEFFRAGRFAEAAACFAQATSLPPGYAVAWGNWGNAHFRLGDREKGLLGHDRALALDPFLVSSWA